MKSYKDLPICWAALYRLTDRLPHELSDDIRRVVTYVVEHEVAKAERENDRKQAEVYNLLMAGEALREKMLLDSIFNGAFDPLTRPANPDKPSST